MANAAPVFDQQSSLPEDLRFWFDERELVKLALEATHMAEQNDGPPNSSEAIFNDTMALDY